MHVLVVFFPVMICATFCELWGCYHCQLTCLCSCNQVTHCGMMAFLQACVGLTAFINCALDGSRNSTVIQCSLKLDNMKQSSEKSALEYQMNHPTNCSSFTGTWHSLLNQQNEKSEMEYCVLCFYTIVYADAFSCLSRHSSTFLAV